MTWLTITWDNDQLLLLSSKKQGKNAVFERAIAVSLRANLDPANSLSESSIYISAVTPANIARELEVAGDGSKEAPIGNAVSNPLLHQWLQSRLKAIIIQEKLVNADTVVVLGRGATEVRTMTFPPVPQEEIPDMVRFQASREFSAYEPNAPIDFLLLDDDDSGEDEKRHILASTIRANLLSDIEILCEEAGLNLRRVVLRPCELTTYWKQQPEYDPKKTYLLAELDFREASLTTVHKGKPVFMRSPKLTTAPFSLAKYDVSESKPNGYGITAQQELSAQLLGEIKRTLIAAQSELQSSENLDVDSVVLCGVAPHHKELARHLTTSLRMPVQLFDPWEGIPRGGELKKSLPPAPERYASLIGSSESAISNRPSEIDYYNPKKKPEPASKQYRSYAIAAAIALVLIGAIAFGGLRKSGVQKELKFESGRTTALKDEAETATRKIDQYISLYDWETQNVNWLDEIAWFSKTVPGAQDIVFENLNCRNNRSMTNNRQAIGTISVAGLAKNTSVVAPMEERLREGNTHEVQAGKKSDDTSRPGYNLRVDYTVSVLAPSENVDTGEE